MQTLNTAPTNTRQPLLRVVKRSPPPRGRVFAIRGLAFLGALSVGGILILFLGHSPLLVYRAMLLGAMGTGLAARETVRIAVPLLLTGLGIGLAFKMRFWNIGAQGQIIMGSIAASYFALFQYKNIPATLLLPIMLVASLVAGGLWGLIPAVFKARWGTNETLFTLMLNYIALEVLRYLQFGPWRDPRQMGFPKIAMFVDAARLPKLFGVHIGWVAALLLAVAAYFYMEKSKAGYEITVVGESVATAKYAGMNVGKIIMRSMFISGAVCGLTGYFLVAGANYTLTESVAGSVGFTAITVAWLAKLNPGIMLLVSLFIAMLQKGANSIQTIFKIPSSAAEIITGLVLFFMLGCEFFLSYRLVLRGKKEGENA